MTDTNIKYMIQRAKTMAEMGMDLIFQWPPNSSLDDDELSWRLNIILETVRDNLSSVEAIIKANPQPFES